MRIGQRDTGTGTGTGTGTCSQSDCLFYIRVARPGSDPEIWHDWDQKYEL